jgi:PadR family transcriptional regulator PadR
MEATHWPSDWMRAVLGLSVLKALDGGPTYGYAIVGALEEAGFGAIKGGTLYPVLSRFEAAGWVTAEWAAGEGGPGRKYFSLTDDGLHELERQTTQWGRFTDMTHKHLQGGSDS